jgi:amidohydrolase
MKKLRFLIANLAFLLCFIIIKLADCNAQSLNKSKENTPGELLWNKIDKLSLVVENKVIAWRRDIHQNPELGNREFRTSKLIADHLKKLGMEVRTGVAHTGVVGILKGKSEGPVIALRADMDALPVKEMVDLPFASKVMDNVNGKQVPVMHACGHDAHVAILMGVAEVLSQLRNELPGTIKFIFQPAEDSNPDGIEGGAALMVKEGVLENPKVDAILGLHVVPYPASTISYRPGGIFAAVDNFSITVKGMQTHGALPWTGIDAIPISAQIVLGLQTIISRQIDLTEAPAFLSIGTIHGGTQVNILAGEVKLEGTVRTFSEAMQKDIQERIGRTSANIAESAGATADVSFIPGVPVVYNDPVLTEMLSGTLTKVASGTGISIARPVTVGDDFSFFTQNLPGMYFLLGITPKGVDPYKAINHSPFFVIDESALIKGVEALSHMAYAYLSGNK